MQNKFTHTTIACLVALQLIGCASVNIEPSKNAHLKNDDEQQVPPPSIPRPVQQTLTAPAPGAREKLETYSVVANNLPAHDLLFALARDAKLNIDIHPGISGNITLNAVDQTLAQILSRISRQIDVRYEQEGPNLAIMPDSPFLKHYKVDYINMSRQVSGTVSTNTQIATNSPVSGNSSMPSTAAAGGNVSNTRIENSSRNQFWESLEHNIKDLLRETDKALPEGSSETQVEQNTSQVASGIAALPHAAGRRGAQAIANTLQSAPNPSSSAQSTGNSIIRRNTFREAASVIINPESGILTIRATQRQHDRIREFIDHVAAAVRRQVLIEATIVEVALADGYQQGINWSKVAGGGALEYLGNPLGGGVNLSYRKNGDPDTLINLLQSFGTTKVLSSPRLSVMNNQTALLKVVENYVYFTVKADTTSTANVGTSTVYTTTPQSVSVGLIVSVTPQISDHNMIVLNIRPSITSVAREVPDPNPELLKNAIKNNVPVIRTREIESIMRIASGNTAILGGLMQDQSDYQSQRIPLLGEIPLFGELLTNRNNNSRKSELVIFLRPIVITDASLEGDYGPLRHFLPGTGFLQPPSHVTAPLQYPN